MVGLIWVGLLFTGFVGYVWVVGYASGVNADICYNLALVVWDIVLMFVSAVVSCFEVRD